MKIFYSSLALKKIAKLPKKDKTRVMKAIRKITTSPYEGKKLKGELKTLWAVRAWPYRVLYRLLKGTLVIVTVENRQRVYKS